MTGSARVRSHATHAGRALPSEIFLARMNAAADTDVTVMLACETAMRGRAVMAALIAEGNRQPAAKIGVRARQLEPVRRAPLAFGPIALGPSPTRAGPIDVAQALDDPSLVIARWSHLAGDAQSCQELVLDGLERAGLLEDRPACHCVRLPANASRPLVPADAWMALRRTRSAGLLEAQRAVRPAVEPMIRPAAARLAVADAQAVPGPADAFAVVTMPSNPMGGGASRFASVTTAVSALFGHEGRAPARLGITVDVRRHEERIAGPGTAGNLSLVGWINVPQGPGAAAAAHARIQNLLKRRFWRQQLAFDAWLGGWSPAVVARACDILIGRLADRAPVTVTELWRDDGPCCASCGYHRRRLPAGISPVVVPPALPPAGLTVGITRTERETIAVLRRVTRPGTSALAWIDAMTPRLQGGELKLSGAVSLS